MEVFLRVYDDEVAKVLPSFTTITSERNKCIPMKKPHSEKLMKISQAAEAAGVSKQTIEYYIMLGLIEPITPPNSRRRFFDDNLVKRIKLIHELNASGYTLREIRTTWMRPKSGGSRLKKSKKSR